MIEFKPKWLLQSPSAPEGSVRCRQCARIAQRNAENARNQEPLIKYSFCPLDLTSKDPAIMIRVTQQILEPGLTETKVRRFAKWLSTTTLVTHLRDMQRLMDRKGVLEADVKDQDFLVAMTLRDCSVFVRLPGNDDDAIDARIGDLDLKSPDKAEYWKKIERPLIEEGWYMGTEKAEDKQPNICALSPERVNPPHPPKPVRSLSDSFEDPFS